MAIGATIGAIGALAQAGGQIAAGVSQGRTARELEQHQRPKYVIPGQVGEATQMNRMAYGDPRMPGYDLAQERMDASLSNLIGAGRRTSGSASALSALVGAGISSRQKGEVQLAVESARNQERQRQALQQSLATEAAYSDKAWQLNKFDPYQADASAAAALRGSQMQNYFGALQGLAKAGTSFTGSQKSVGEVLGRTDAG